MRRRLLLAALVATALTGGPAHSQSLRDALEGAWSRQPAARAAGARTDEFAAKRDAAGDVVSRAAKHQPRVPHRPAQQNYGTREFEGVLSLPVSMPGTRAAAQALALAESGQFDARCSAQRWRLAGEVREAYWLARLAAAEQELAQRKVDEATALSADVERRLKAGDLARTDLNSARGSEQLARAALADARARAYPGCAGVYRADRTEIASGRHRARGRACAGPRGAPAARRGRTHRRYRPGQARTGDGRDTRPARDRAGHAPRARRVR